MANKEKLFTEFQAPTTQEWLDKIEVDLAMRASMCSPSIAVRT